MAGEAVTVCVEGARIARFCFRAHSISPWIEK
jgi:hypothetical protein